MSRLAKKPVQLPVGVAVREEDGSLTVKGPKGEKSFKVLPGVKLEIRGDSVFVSTALADTQGRTNVGTMWSLITNAVSGTTAEFSKVLEIEGVGYRAVLEGDTLVLFLGYVEPVRLKISSGVHIVIEKSIIRISGIDKDLVARTAAQIRALKKPEPYKGKGIRYQGEIIKRKVGKKAAATTGAAAS